MLFSGKLRSYQKQPRIYGRLGKTEECHEFLSVSDVKVKENKTDTEFTLVAGPLVTCRISEGTMFGPASSILTKTVMYPCNYHRCKIPCACKICRCKETFCPNYEHKKLWGPCSDCVRDFDDHSLFHLVIHQSCKFCLNMHDMLPMIKFVTRSTEGYWPYYNDVYHPAWLFEHRGCVMYPNKDSFEKYPCNKCETSFESKFNLKRHEKSQHLDVKIPCPFCDMKFTRSDNLKKHKRSKHKNHDDHKGSTYECNECKSKFSRKNHFERHLSITKQPCDLCSETFCTVRQIQQHKLKHHSKFSCSLCMKSFPDKANLLKHNERSRDADNSMKNICQNCDEKFCTEADYNKHMKSHPRAVIECSYCGKKFTSKWRHRVHLLKSQELKCKDCEFKVCSGYDLKIHINAVHSN